MSKMSQKIAIYTHLMNEQMSNWVRVKHMPVILGWLEIHDHLFFFVALASFDKNDISSVVVQLLLIRNGGWLAKEELKRLLQFY